MKPFYTLATLCGLASAHFKLKYPESIGFEDAKEDTAPCGGFTPDLSGKLVDFHVGGEALAMRMTHPQCNWLFRVTTDEKAESGWEQVYPIVMQSGLGDFCIPQVTVPEKYVGKKGIVSIVSSAMDGLLYQCVAANFVSGSQEAPSECKNASITASFTSDSQLSALVDSGATTSGTGSASNTSPTSQSSPSPSSAAEALTVMGTGMGGITALLGLAVVAGIAAV